MRKKILFFTDSAGFGGAEKILLNLMVGLDQECWEPTLFHHGEPGIAPLIKASKALEIPTLVVPDLPLGLQGARRAISLAQVIRRERPAIFHAHLTWPLSCKYGLVAARLAGVPVITANVQLFVDTFYTKATRLQMQLLAAGIDRYIAVSQDLARELRCAFSLPERKVQVIHNGIPLGSTLQPAAEQLHAQFVGNSGKRLVFTAARLEEQKGLGFLLEAAAQVHEALFVVAGDGPQRLVLEEHAGRLGLSERVIFLGFRTDVADWMAACDLFVLPSLYEGLPLSILEAMSAGKAVVATAVGGNDEAVIGGETGLLVRPGDSQALAEAIRSLLAVPERARRMGKAGQARVMREFSLERMVNQYNELYAELLSQKRQDYE